jgi:hypothetical protein
MGIRRLLAVGAAGVAAALGITTAASAVTGSGIAAAPDSLRALAAKPGLRIGTAVIPFDLDHPRTRPSLRASSRSSLRETR